MRRVGPTAREKMAPARMIAESLTPKHVCIVQRMRRGLLTPTNYVTRLTMASHSLLKGQRCGVLHLIEKIEHDCKRSLRCCTQHWHRSAFWLR
jgi:hypothetical protein